MHRVVKRRQIKALLLTKLLIIKNYKAMRLYTCENKEMFYAKEIFYNSISEYQKASGEGKREMIEMIKKKMKERLHWNYGIDDCYTIASRWFIRLENWLNTNL